MLQAFILEQAPRVFNFSALMLPSDTDIDELVLAIFREFGDAYRRLAKKEGGREPLEIQISLFKIAWEHIRGQIAGARFHWLVGRDTRQLKELDQDILRAWKDCSKDVSYLKHHGVTLIERLNRLDLDFRAPLVLRDVLNFEDEEVLRILGIRWGVYRLRLHRGRIDFSDKLRGQAISGPGRSMNATDGAV